MSFLPFLHSCLTRRLVYIYRKIQNFFVFLICERACAHFQHRLKVRPSRRRPLVPAGQRRGYAGQASTSLPKNIRGLWTPRRGSDTLLLSGSNNTLGSYFIFIFFSSSVGETNKREKEEEEDEEEEEEKLADFSDSSSGCFNF